MKQGSGGPGGAGVSRWQRVLSRPVLLGIGWVAVTLGMAGLLVPVVPTVPFLLVALWAFARSSQRFHDWLYHHPRLGPPLRDWRDHGAISLPAKVLAIGGVAASLGWITFAVAEDWILPALIAALFIPAAVFIVTRPRRPSG